jgi:hypothetical protein
MDTQAVFKVLTAVLDGGAARLARPALEDGPPIALHG